VLILSNVVLAAGLVLLAATNGPVLLAIAWAVLGIGKSKIKQRDVTVTLPGSWIPPSCSFAEG
jgi:hypothetical protein